MADTKKQVEQITSQEKDFAQWYTDVCLKSELCIYSGVKGFVVIRPYGWALWENVMNNVDARLKKMGVTNVAMPVLIPEHLLLKEKEHVEGFAPECAWVACGGDDILEDRLAVRPTSETVFCDYWHDVVHSYRDLPQLLCQWGSVVRWEKETRPFLRTREFFWHEGHTLHATPEESLKFTLDILYMYEDFIQNDAAIPVLKGKKTEKERFAGAQATYTVESIMKDGKALQSGTSHDFGDNFAKAFDIKYLDKNNKLTYATETSWAISSRIIGALIMVHGDDNGLKLPPHLAPIQVRVVPIRMTDKNNVEKANEIYNNLKKCGIRADIDLSDKTPGYKFSDCEMKGIPLRLEIGPKDIEKGVCVLVRRDTGEKIEVKLNELESKVKEILELIQKNMFEVAKKFLDDHIDVALTKEELISKMNNKKGFIKAMHCGCEECEIALKDETGISSRCIPMEQEQLSDKCVVCGKPAKYEVIWGSHIKELGNSPTFLLVFELKICYNKLMLKINDVKINIPKYPKMIIDTLEKNGYEAYIVGGCVRDALLGNAPSDYDITTNADPQTVKKLFKRTIDTGIKHGTVTVLFYEDNKPYTYEVTTFRIDGEYDDSRHPKEVVFVKDLKEDLLRRDFTVNAMAYNEKVGLVDEFGGIVDLDKKIIRAVGNPVERFTEDALRLLRAVRFSAKLGFAIEDETRYAIPRLAPSLKFVSKERVQVELTKTITSDNPEYVKMVFDLGLSYYISDNFSLVKMGRFNKKLPIHIAYACLLYNTEITVANKVLRELKIDNSTIAKTLALLDSKNIYKDISKSYNSNKYGDVNIKIKELVNFLGYDLCYDFIGLININELDSRLIDKIESTVNSFRDENCPIFLKDLKVDGNDMMSIGFNGQEIGVALNELLRIVHKNRAYNDKKLLQEMAKKAYNTYRGVAYEL